jgi:hypothetical protein
MSGLIQDLYRLNPENAAFLNARLLQQSAPKQTLAPYMLISAEK